MTYAEVEEYLKNNQDKEIIVEDMDEEWNAEKYIKLKYGIPSTTYIGWSTLETVLRESTRPCGDWLFPEYRSHNLRILSDEEITLALL